MLDKVGERKSEARERVLQVAERIFSERGYIAVTMRDIATALGIRQASLYHHVPGGKEQLFIEVTERSLERHKHGLQIVLQQASPDLRKQLRAVASWLLSQPPLDLTRLFRVDLPEMSAEHADRLVQVVVDGLFYPLAMTFQAAYERGEIRMADYKVLAISFLAVVETYHDVQRYTNTPKEALASDIIDVMLDGLQRV